jgi:glutamate racemase
VKIARIKSLFSVLWIFLFLSCSGNQPPLSESEKLETFFEKGHVKILVIDSGLGGLSVAANLYPRLQEYRLFQKVEIIFFNAQPHIKSGYNLIKTKEKKIKVFESALAAMLSEWDPDMLLIACNTLSVLFPETGYATTLQIPVMGVVEKGVDLIEKNVPKNSDSGVIIMATRTTISQGNHKRLLLKKGFSEEQIITQACPGLAGSIERGTQSPETEKLVSAFTDSIEKKLTRNYSRLYLSLNCTHYGYISRQLMQALLQRNIRIERLLNPNPFMLDFIFRPELKDRYTETDLTIRVFSQPDLPPERLESIAPLLAVESPQAAEALENYSYVPDLFEWRSIVGSDTL